MFFISQSLRSLIQDCLTVFSNFLYQSSNLWCSIRCEISCKVSFLFTFSWRTLSSSSFSYRFLFSSIWWSRSLLTKSHFSFCFYFSSAITNSTGPFFPVSSINWGCFYSQSRILCSFHDLSKFFDDKIYSLKSKTYLSFLSLISELSLSYLISFSFSISYPSNKTYLSLIACYFKKFKYLVRAWVSTLLAWDVSYHV